MILNVRSGLFFFQRKGWAQKLDRRLLLTTKNNRSDHVPWNVRRKYKWSIPPCLIKHHDTKTSPVSQVAVVCIQDGPSNTHPSPRSQRTSPTAATASLKGVKLREMFCFASSFVHIPTRQTIEIIASISLLFSVSVLSSNIFLVSYHKETGAVLCETASVWTMVPLGKPIQESKRELAYQKW
jgi:hypothetical protein